MSYFFLFGVINKSSWTLERYFLYCRHYQPQLLHGDSQSLVLALLYTNTFSNDLTLTLLALLSSASASEWDLIFILTPTKLKIISLYILCSCFLNIFNAELHPRVSVVHFWKFKVNNHIGYTVE